MTAVTLHFAVPPSRLDHDPSWYLESVDNGMKWPLEPSEVLLQDLRPELDDMSRSIESRSIMGQLESRGFAAFRSPSPSAGPLLNAEDWSAEYLEVSTATLCCSFARPCVGP